MPEWPKERWEQNIGGKWVPCEPPTCALDRTQKRRTGWSYCRPHYAMSSKQYAGCHWRVKVEYPEDILREAAEGIQ